jgi:hypothetical protein
MVSVALALNTVDADPNIQSGDYYTQAGIDLRFFQNRIRLEFYILIQEK